MPTEYRLTSTTPIRIGTTRTLTISTAAATYVVSMSGYFGWQLVNVGPSTITYGDSSMAMGSGAFLYYSVEKTWLPIADTMGVHLRADSVAGVVLINEFL